MIIIKKLDLQHIKDFAERYGFEVLSDEYKNAQIPLKFRCPNGHVREMLWHNFKKRKSCGECVGNQRFSFDFAKKEFEKHGFELLDNNYINSSTPLHVRCSEGHESYKTLTSLRSGQGCKFCASNRPIDILRMAESFKNEGYIVDCDLAEVYTNNRSKIPLICPNKHNVGISWKHYLNGVRCRRCNGGSRLTQDEVREMLLEIGIELLSEYVNYDAKIRYRCTCGNAEAYGYFKALMNGVRCGCGYKSGEESPFWNPNISQEERERQRNYPEYHGWVKNVYIRDDYRCQCCGERGGKLHAHHIYNYSEHADLRTILENGITLCKLCHKDFHNTYGYTGNDEFQLKEYIAEIQNEILSSV